MDTFPALKPIGSLAALLALAACEADLMGPVTANRAPAIYALSANSLYHTQLDRAITFAAEAYDPDGDGVAYLWEADGGTLDDRHSRTVIWTPPAQAGTYRLRLSVTDGRGGEATGTVAVVIGDGRVVVQTPVVSASSAPAPSAAPSASGAPAASSAPSAQASSWPGAVSTLAGSGDAGYLDGNVRSVKFWDPTAIAVDNQGNVFVADRYNNRIRTITPLGAVATLAGNQTAGADNGTGTEASFADPQGLAIDQDGNLYVADTNNHRIRKINRGGLVTTLAGEVEGYQDSQGLRARFRSPVAVAVDADGNVYTADTVKPRIRKITPDGTVTTIAGNGLKTYRDAPDTAASFVRPAAMVVGSDGYLYLSEPDLHVIRRIKLADGQVSTYAGNGAPGLADGKEQQAFFNQPMGLAFDDAGRLLVADAGNHRIRRIEPGGRVTTLAGGSSGDVDGALAQARFNFPAGLATDANGNAYVADTHNHRIRYMRLR